MTITNGAFGGGLAGLGGVLGGLGMGIQQPGQQIPYQCPPEQLFAQLQAQQQFNLAGTSQNGLSDLMRGQRPFPFCHATDDPEPEPEPPRYRSRAWGVLVVRW